RRMAAGKISKTSPSGARMTKVSWRPIATHGWSKVTTMPSRKNRLGTRPEWLRCWSSASMRLRGGGDIEPFDGHALEREGSVDVGRGPVELDRVRGLDEGEQQVEQRLRVRRHGVEPKVFEIGPHLLGAGEDRVVENFQVRDRGPGQLGQAL